MQALGKCQIAYVILKTQIVFNKVQIGKGGRGEA